MAMGIYLCLNMIVAELLPERRLVQDDELLKGVVPHFVDWLRAWRQLKETVRCRSCGQL